MKKNMLIAIVLLVLAGGGIWLTRAQTQPTPSGDQMIEPTSTMPVVESPGTTEKVVSTMDGEIVKDIVVEATEFKFIPATLTLKKGEKVNIVLKNTGKMPHDFVVDELDFKTKTVNSGSQESFEFTPDKAGTFEYYCSIGKHREMGMKGTLTVE